MVIKRINRLISKVLSINGAEENFYLASSGSSFVVSLNDSSNTPSVSSQILTVGADSTISGTTFQATNQYISEKVGVGTGSPQVPLDVIDMGGMVLSQTIIDGVAAGFSCETNSTTYKQINDDIDDAKKASVTFTVPASNKVWVSMKTSIRDFDSTEKIFYVRVTDSDSESTQGSWGAGNFNDEQVAGYYAEEFSIHIFQWYFDGSYTSLNWSPGETKTMYFQIKVQDVTEQVSVKAGGTSYGPMSVTAESVPNNVNFVDMDI
tara:strand:- start:1454 stop:2242 length:789 start_codon:yes stop_codon:yes gene_type:complete